MARPPRIEFPGALYHLTARGDGREDIDLDDEDREQLPGRYVPELPGTGVQGPTLCWT